MGMLLVVRVFCCPEYRNWQSLMCNEVLNGGGGGGLDVLGGDDHINILSVRLYIVRRVLKLNI